MLLVCFEGLARLSRRVRRRFVRGSREISLVPSLHRASTDALIPASGSTTGVLTDELVIVGGWKSSSSVSCVYQLIEDTWVTVGTVSNGTECLTASTPANQLVIVGGDGGCQNVCICSVY